MVAAGNADETETDAGEKFLAGVAEGNAGYVPIEDEITAALEAEEFAPSYVLNNEGDYFAGVFTGELSSVTRDFGWGEQTVYIVELEFIEGDGKLIDGESPTKGDIVSFWLFNAAYESKFRRAAPTAGETVVVKNKGTRKNRDKTNEYTDCTVAVLGRGTAAKRLSWGDLPSPDSDIPAVSAGRSGAPSKAGNGAPGKSGKVTAKGTASKSEAGF